MRPDQPVLKNLSFEVKKGQKHHGMVGRGQIGQAPGGHPPKTQRRMKAMKVRGCWKFAQHFLFYRMQYSFKMNIQVHAVLN